MKLTNLKALEQNIQEGLAPIYLIIGKDDFERKTATETLLRRWPKDNICLFEGQKFSIKELLQELNTQSFFAKNRAVVIDNLDKIALSTLAPLQEYITNPEPTICLILCGTTFSKTSNLFKQIEKAGVVLDIAEEKPWEKEKNLAARLSVKLTAEAKTMDAQTSSAFIKLVGADAATLYQELEKLICFVGDRKAITLQDVTSVVAGGSHETIWQLGDAIFGRNAGVALRIIEALLQDTALIALLRQLRTQVQTKLQICEILAGGGTPDAVSQKFPYMKGNILSNNIGLAQGYGLQRLHKAIIEIDETELKAKNSATDLTLLAQLLIFKLTK